MIRNSFCKVSRSWMRVASWIVLFSSMAVFPSLADYKVILKDGKVIEAKSKPISMEGHFRFMTVDNKFHTLPIQLIDLIATEAANRSNPNEDNRQVKRHFTNEDVSSSGIENLPLPKSTKTASAPSKLPIKESIPKKEEHQGETYWRKQAKLIKDQISAIDSEIKKINQKTSSKVSDGIQIGFDTYNQHIKANFDSQIKFLEKEKEKLEKQFIVLEEEARKAGALPGWLR